MLVNYALPAASPERLIALITKTMSTFYKKSTFILTQKPLIDATQSTVYRDTLLTLLT